MSARRSHPPSLLRLTERLVRDEHLFARGDVVLCACSGGPDSTALLHVIARLRETIGHTVVAHGVDHGLRADADAELALAAGVAAANDVPFTVTRVRVAPGGNLQARARAARHEALAGAAEAAGARVVATGHTADDRAETLLLRLLRGAGPRGLAVLPPRAPLPASADVELIRPLLGARRRDVLAHLERHALPFAHDPSNRDPRFTRARVRHELVPLLEELSPGVVEHLSSLADMLANAPDDATLDGLGRAQRLAVERARRMGRRSVRLRLPGGREVEATFPDGRIVLIESR
ncbi:tRNA(Ile)-lysidine synthetase [Minicystis rosea]|nr:tRNA(Ile)-lysidine synthetase [Minicystis rosea]